MRSWTDDDLAEPAGPAEGPYGELSRADLVAHIHRELIHHLAEVVDLQGGHLRPALQPGDLQQVLHQAPQPAHLRNIVALIWRSMVLWMLLLSLLSLANLVG